METDDGELIVMRRPDAGEICCAEDFLPCYHCLGFTKRRDLWKYVASCKFKPEDKDEENSKKYEKVQLKSKMIIMESITKEENSVLNKVIASMKKDEFSVLVWNDVMIKRLGSMLVEKLGDKNGQLISPKMRELARLLKQLMEIDNSPSAQLSEFTKPSKFDVVVEAVKTLCNFEVKDGEQEVQIPSLALKLDHSLKKCVNIVRSQALRAKDKDHLEEANNFEKLLECEWSFRISRHSLNTL